MFGKRYQLFTLFGFKVWADATWLVLAILIVWSLAVGFFPARLGGLPRAVYWLMGVGGAVGLFLSIVLHELAHSLVARRHGIPMRGITLFVFGGVAEMTDEPPTPRGEFLMALAGPVASLVLGAALLAVAALLPRSPVEVVLGYLGVINLLLAAFNLVPAFPLDGGRLLRAALWRWRGSLAWATRLSARIGSGFGLALMASGAAWVFLGHFVSGLWWFLIGWFVRGAARSSYQQLLARRALQGEPVRRFMREDPVTVPAATSLAGLVADYVYRFGYTSYPVVSGDRLVGSVDLDHLRAVPRDEWERTTVGAVAQPSTPDNTVSPDVEVVAALATMTRAGVSRLLVVEAERLVGVLALKDLLQFLALRSELEPDADAEPRGPHGHPWSGHHRGA